MKISFDFDLCLGETHIQNLATILIAGGADIWILTARVHDHVYENGKIIGHKGINMDIRQICKKLGISENKIIFTGGSLKYKLYKEHGFDLHFDDDIREVEMIRRNGGKAMLVEMDLRDIVYELHNVDDLNNYLNF